MLGETEMEEPVPTDVPPQLPRYQTHDAPVPNEPPSLVSADESPGQMEPGLVDAPPGELDRDLTVSVALPLVLKKPHETSTWHA